MNPPDFSDDFPRRKSAIPGIETLAYGRPLIASAAATALGLFTNSFIWASEDTPRAVREISTAYLNLQLESRSVPVARDGHGGGLTAVGDELLLLTHEGTIYEAWDSHVRRTDLRVPDNGFDDYVRAAQTEQFRNLEHRFDRFRYNDILYYSSGEDAGLVVSYSQWLEGEKCYGTAVARLPLTHEDDSIAEIEAAGNRWEIVYRTRPCLPLKTEFRAIEGHIAGGRIAYRPPNKLVLGSGDYHWDGVYAPRALAQLDDNDYGKVLEIDIGNRSARIISMGNRNPQGVLIDDAGQLWTVEHGPRGGDELNRIDEGKNYGWPVATLGTRYNRLPWPGTRQYGRHDDFTAPVYAWVPSVGASGITQVRNFHPSWDGDLLIASLRGSSLFRLRMHDGHVVYSEPISIGERVRYVHQHTDGRIVLWTDSHLLIFVSAAENSPMDEFIDRWIVDSALTQPRRIRLKQVVSECSECHHSEPHGRTGETLLTDILGRRIGLNSVQSRWLAPVEQELFWDENTLSEFLKNPTDFAPASTMPNPQLSDQDISDLIRLFQAFESVERLNPGTR